MNETLDNIIDLMPHLEQQRIAEDARRLQEIAKLAAHLEEKAKSDSSECSEATAPGPSADPDANS